MVTRKASENKDDDIVKKKKKVSEIGNSTNEREKLFHSMTIRFP